VERIAYGADDGIVGHKTGTSFIPLKAFRGGPDARLNRRIEVLDARLIGKSEVMQSLKMSIRTVASSSETVLITGESGTGKELIARAVHDLSARHSQPFLAVNCGAITESLLGQSCLAM
jgi:DNA-binding NtrC family response regulator